MFDALLAALAIPPPTAAPAGPMSRDGAVLVLAGIGALVGVGYWISLYLHPYARCGSCKGAGRTRGGVFTHSFGLCRRCGGTGRKRRFGSRLFLSQR